MMNTKSKLKQVEPETSATHLAETFVAPVAAIPFAERLVFTIQEAALLLNICEKSVHRLIQRGKLRCISSLRHKRIPRAELDRFLKEELN